LAKEGRKFQGSLTSPHIREGTVGGAGVEYQPFGVGSQGRKSKKGIEKIKKGAQQGLSQTYKVGGEKSTSCGREAANKRKGPPLSGGQ